MSECRKHLNGFQYKKLICPFENDYSALVKFETQKGLRCLYYSLISCYIVLHLYHTSLKCLALKLTMLLGKFEIHVLKLQNNFSQ